MSFRRPPALLVGSEMEEWDKFRAVLLERTEPAKRRYEMFAKARTILLVVAALFLVIVLVVLVRDRMPLYRPPSSVRSRASKSKVRRFETLSRTPAKGCPSGMNVLQSESPCPLQEVNSDSRRGPHISALGFWSLLPGNRGLPTSSWPNSLATAANTE